jgi:hypothetical protein
MAENRRLQTSCVPDGAWDAVREQIDSYEEIIVFG